MASVLSLLQSDWCRRFPGGRTNPGLGLQPVLSLRVRTGAAHLGYLRLAKAVLSAVSVVKADRVQGGAATNRVRREISVSVATNGPSW